MRAEGWEAKKPIDPDSLVARDVLHESLRLIRLSLIHPKLPEVRKAQNSRCAGHGGNPDEVASIPVASR